MLHWHRLDRDKTVAMINNVRASGVGSLFSPATSEAKYIPLPFYKDVYLYRLSNMASLPTFTMPYLGTGTMFTYLDGTEASIYSVNDTGALLLDDSTVLPYLAFFFRHTLPIEGETHLVADPEHLPFMEDPDYEPDYTNLGPLPFAQVYRHDQGDGYAIETPLYNEGMIVKARIHVNNRGRVAIIDQQLWISDRLGDRTGEIGPGFYDS